MRVTLARQLAQRSDAHIQNAPIAFSAMLPATTACPISWRCRTNPKLRPIPRLQDQHSRSTCAASGFTNWMSLPCSAG